MKKFFSNSKGYTLVEMLAVIIVFAIIGGIITVIFTSSLRSSNKAKTTNEIRENGNYAVLQMSKMITFARSFEGVKENEEDEYFIADCYGKEPSDYHVLKISTFDGSDIIFSCLGGDDGDIASDGASLIDKNIVRIDSCSFSCKQPSLSQPPTIGINFTLSQPPNSSSFFEHKATIPFNTTVVMRNARR